MVKDLMDAVGFIAFLVLWYVALVMGLQIN